MEAWNTYEEYRVVYIQKQDHLMWFLHTIDQLQTSLVSFDIETTTSARTNGLDLLSISVPHKRGALSGIPCTDLGDIHASADVLTALIDISSLSNPSAIRSLFGDRSITKVGCGADGDLDLLRKVLGIQVRNFVDLQHLETAKGYAGGSLGSIATKYGVGRKAEWSHIRKEWRGKLSQEASLYAATDAVITLGAFIRMLNVKISPPRMRGDQEIAVWVARSKKLLSMSSIFLSTSPTSLGKVEKVLRSQGIFKGVRKDELNPLSALVAKVLLRQSFLIPGPGGGLAISAPKDMPKKVTPAVLQRAARCIERISLPKPLNSIVLAVANSVSHKMHVMYRKRMGELCVQELLGKVIFLLGDHVHRTKTSEDLSCKVAAARAVLS